MKEFLHVSPIGISVFDNNLKLIKTIPLDADKFISFTQGNLPVELKSYQQKNPDAVLIDSISINPSSVNSLDYDNFIKVLESLRLQRKFDLFYEANMKLTATKLRSLSMKDFIISQTINNIDETEKIINMMTTRLREWYSLYNPELDKEVEDNKKYSLSVMDDVRGNKSIGGNVSKKDLKPIISLSKKINLMFEFIEEQEKYLVEIMSEYCPNLSAVATELIGARLIALSGSLKRLSIFPSSTIQTLGAEKAMFRHLKSGDRPPKYGIIVLHPLINNQKKNDKGKVARSLASKISIAAKVDFFQGDEFEGYKLKDNLENTIIKSSSKKSDLNNSMKTKIENDGYKNNGYKNNNNYNKHKKGRT